MSLTRRTSFLALLTAALVCPPLSMTALAQQPARIALELTPGWVGFADDGVVSEGLLAGSVRFYVTPRISVGPEVSLISGHNHSHLMLTGNVTFDLIGPRGARPPVMTPFVVAGGGLFRTRENVFNGPYASNDGAFTAGGGVKAHLGDFFVVGGEARIGWELHLRANGIVGVRF